MSKYFTTKNVNYGVHIAQSHTFPTSAHFNNIQAILNTNYMYTMILYMEVWKFFVVKNFCWSMKPLKFFQRKVLKHEVSSRIRPLGFRVHYGTQTHDMHLLSNFRIPNS